MGRYLPEGWTEERIEEATDFQIKHKMFLCYDGCGWVIGKCKHRAYDEVLATKPNGLERGVG